MYVGRTVTRNARYGGLFGGLLYLVYSGPVAATDWTYHDYASRANISSAYATSVSKASGTALVQYTGKVTNLPNSQVRYISGKVPVPLSTLRVGALSALGRGFMHPGLQLAIAAAGFIWSQSDGILKEGSALPAGMDNFYDDYPGTGEVISDRYWQWNAVYYTTPNAALSACLASGICFGSVEKVSCLEDNWYGPYCSKWRYTLRDPAKGYIYLTLSSSSRTADLPVADAPTSLVPATDDDLVSLDEHLPPEIVEQLWSDPGSLPEWMWDVPKVTSDGNVAPEVADAVRQQADNIESTMLGETDQPHTDTGDSEAKTPEEKIADSFDEPVPPFGEVEPQWQVETIDSLPGFSSGIGGGSCPAPISINLPMGQSMSISIQPACDLATMIRGAVIGVCGLIALMIVVRARGSA